MRRYGSALALPLALGVTLVAWVFVEDYGFGFAMVTLTLLTWHKLTHRRAA